MPDTWKEPPPCDDDTSGMPSGGAGSAPDPDKCCLRAKLKLRAFNVHARPKKPRPTLEFMGHPIATPGNITVLHAAPKAGKSGVIGAIIAAFINGKLQSGADTLEFLSENRDGKSVLHFDTEQSRFDHDALVRVALSRCKREEPPLWFHSWSLADLVTIDRRAAFDLAVEDGTAADGGIHCLLLDGVADFMCDPNDPRESFEIVDWLQALAIRHDCSVITVLHENPGSENGKTRGHLGSQLARKAETSLRLVKDSAGITTMWVPQGRHCDIPQSRGLCFAWNQGAGMHATLGQAGSLREASERGQHVADAERVYQDNGILSYSDLVKGICEACAVKERAAKSRVAKWAALGVVRKEPSGTYRITPSPI